MPAELCSCCDEWYRDTCPVLNKPDCPMNKLVVAANHAMTKRLEVAHEEVIVDPNMISLN